MDCFICTAGILDLKIVRDTEIDVQTVEEQWKHPFRFGYHNKMSTSS